MADQTDLEHPPSVIGDPIFTLGLDVCFEQPEDLVV